MEIQLLSKFSKETIDCFLNFLHQSSMESNSFVLERTILAEVLEKFEPKNPIKLKVSEGIAVMRMIGYLQPGDVSMIDMRHLSAIYIEIYRTLPPRIFSI